MLTRIRYRFARMTNDNAIVILAAGASRRLGIPKQLVEIDGQTLIRHAVETALAADSGSVHVVIGADEARVRAELEGLPVAILVNEQWNEGIASSIRVAVAALRDRATTITLMLCDQPGVTADVLRRLFENFRTMHATVIASRYPEGPGVPALFHKDHFDALQSLRGDIGARQLIRELDRDVVMIPFDSPDDIDTPADIARLR